MPPSVVQIKARFRLNVLADLRRRGQKVQARARVLLAGGAAGHPRRIDTGTLSASISTQIALSGAIPVVRIGTDVRYASWVREGTGIYGPRRQPIRARRRNGYMTFVNKRGRRIFARTVRGYRKNDFLGEALKAAKD